MMNIRLLIKILLFLTIAFSCYSADTVGVYPPQGIIQFKGLDDTSSPLTVQNGRAQDLQNVTLSRALTLQKRYGYSLVNDRLPQAYSTTDQFPAVTGLYSATLSNGTTYRLAISSDRVYYDNSGTWTDVILGVKPTYDKDNQFVWCVGNDTIIFSNDTDPPFKWVAGGNVQSLDLTSLTATSRPTKVKCLSWYKNYLILGNTYENSVEYPTRFRWSDVGTTETFDDDNYLDIAALGGQDIEGFGVLYDNLYAFLTDSIWKITLVGGDDIFVLSKVIDGVGCIAKNSIQTVNFLNQKQGLVFLSRDKKVYFFDGTSVIEISALIRTTMNALSATRLPYAVSADNGKEYILGVTTGSGNTTNNLILVFQYEIGEWTIYTQIDANAMAQVYDSDGIKQIYFGNYDSFVYEMDDENLSSDIDGAVDGVASVGTLDLPDGTATGLQMLIVDTQPITWQATGAIVSLTSGTGEDQEAVIVYHTTTGLVVDSTFTTTPASDTLFSIGDIDSYYKTKWYDLGDASRLKIMDKIYFWAEEASETDITINESLDFGAEMGAESVSLAGSGGVWGTAIWGTDTWGGQEAMFKNINLSGQGRFVNIKFANDEIDEGFNLYGFSMLAYPGNYK